MSIAFGIGVALGLFVGAFFALFKLGMMIVCDIVEVVVSVLGKKAKNIITAAAGSNVEPVKVK